MIEGVLLAAFSPYTWCVKIPPTGVLFIKFAPSTTKTDYDTNFKFFMDGAREALLQVIEAIFDIFF